LTIVSLKHVLSIV